MSQNQNYKKFLIVVLAFLSSSGLCAEESENSVSLETQVEGLWLYTGLTTSTGKELPQDGVFLLKNGQFVQYSVYRGEPVEEQPAMAHSGIFSVKDGFVHLTAKQTLSTAPGETSALQSMGVTEHDLAVERSGEDLRLVFSKGIGTVQLFKLIAPGSGDLYWLEDGALALLDGHFILVDGNEHKINAGYGTYKTGKGSIEINIVRWTKAAPGFAENSYDTSIKGSFDGKTLALEDGRVFKVKP